MLNTWKKKFVCMDSMKNEFGFTMISMLLALSFFVIASPLLSYTLKSTQMTTLYEELSVEQFFSFVRSEMALSHSVTVLYNTLNYEIYSQGEEWLDATMKMKENQVIRNLNGGHEVYLFDVKYMEFKHLDHSLEISLITSSGKSYRKIIRLYD